ncbi:MAG: transposase [Desulfohalobiaceae bacterium]
MNCIDYKSLISSEPLARRYILGFCWNKWQRFCPKCSHRKVYRLSDSRRRCSRCKYTFHDLSRRWINFGGLSCLEWIRLIKLFEQELTANKMVPRLKHSYNTIYKAVTTLRLSILAQASDGGSLLQSELGRDLGFDGKRICLEKKDGRIKSIPVFGIHGNNGSVTIDYLPNMEAETVFHFNHNFGLKLVRMGNIVYTDRYQGFDALIFCGDGRLPYEYIKNRERGAFVDSLDTSFWSFARPRIKRYNGISPRRFPLYLKELEFRYNNHNQDLFSLFTQSLCSFVPDFTQGPACLPDGYPSS